MPGGIHLQTFDRSTSSLNTWTSNHTDACTEKAMAKLQTMQLVSVPKQLTRTP